MRRLIAHLYTLHGLFIYLLALKKVFVTIPRRLITLDLRVTSRPKGTNRYIAFPGSLLGSGIFFSIYINGSVSISYNLSRMVGVAQEFHVVT